MSNFFHELMSVEFPEYDQSTLPPIPEGWVDSSWHNDTCPSFFDEDAKTTIYIAEASPAEREMGGVRFYVLSPEDDSFQTDDWQAVLDYVNERACPRQNGSHRDTGRGVCAHCGKVL